MMKYETPQLVEVGSAAALVLGGIPGTGDSANPDFERSMEGVVLGLDD